MAHESTVVRALRDRFEHGVLETIPKAHVNGDPVHRLPNTSNLAFDGIDSEAVLMLLDQPASVLPGSACTTGSLHPSHVLKAMGFSDERARSSLRFSFSRFNTARKNRPRRWRSSSRPWRNCASLALVS